MKTFREVANKIVELEVEKNAILSEYEGYYSTYAIRELDKFYEKVIREVYEGYFGEVGSMLYDYWSEVIATCLLDRLTNK